VTRKKDTEGTSNIASAAGKGDNNHNIMMPYEEALLAESSTEVVEIEVLSNQAAVRGISRPGGVRSKKEFTAEANQAGTHVIVYQIPIDFGRIQKGALINDVTGVVRLLPSEVAKTEIAGHKYSEHSDVLRTLPRCLKVGSASLKVAHGKSLVDPSWGRGRQWFYGGRSKGIL
jgi:hypothetical protein